MGNDYISFEPLYKSLACMVWPGIATQSRWKNCPYVSKSELKTEKRVFRQSVTPKSLEIETLNFQNR